MLVFVSASHGSPSSAPSRNLRNRTSCYRISHREHLPRGYCVCPLGAVFEIPPSTPQTVDLTSNYIPPRFSLQNGSRSVSIRLTLSSLALFPLPWRWRRYFPPKRRFILNPHDATSQKTAFFKCDVISSLFMMILTKFYILRLVPNTGFCITAFWKM
jgi:hypothetical protein